MIIVDVHEDKVYAKLVENKKSQLTQMSLSTGDKRAGDFIISSHPPLIIERKAIGDLMHSWFAGRLQEQIAYMHSTMVGDEKPIPMLIVEGSMSAYLKYTKKVHPNTIAGVIASLAGAWKIVMLPSASVTMTAYILDALDRFLVTKSNESHIHIHTSEISHTDCRLNILACVDDMGAVRAQKLMEHGHTLADIAGMSVEQLQDIVGKKAGENVYEAFHEVYHGHEAKNDEQQN